MMVIIIMIMIGDDSHCNYDDDNVGDDDYPW